MPRPAGPDTGQDNTQQPKPDPNVQRYIREVEAPHEAKLRGIDEIDHGSVLNAVERIAGGPGDNAAQPDHANPRH
ncbi:MAG: hypothetical protein QOG73_3838 [Acetobacteraceae bacterium]|nr:hypothetical protein [Acetobacteraceae bacterium]